MQYFTNTSRNSEKETVIVTGSSGLIGTQIIKRLSEKFNIVGLDREGNPHPPIEAECVCFDITSEESIKKAMERVNYAYGKKIASVIHLAAYYDFSGKPSSLYEEVTVKGTENFVKVLQDFEVEQFIFSSTNLIYRPTEPGRKIHEDCPVAPNWDYPESKVDTEQIIRENRGDMKAVLLRLAGVYDDDGHSIPVSHQIQRIYEKQFTSHFYSGDTSHGNVFLHMEDLLDALERTVEKRKSLPEEIAINIGEPETPSYQKMQNKIGKLIHGEEWETYEIPKPIAKAGAWAMDLFGDPFIKPWMIDRADDHYELDISRAKELLNWEPGHSLIATLPDMIEKLKSDPLNWYHENNLEPPSEL
ncbi:NAD(P)-dependent oxidoreductase [uncultured Algoriphagus sp.]|uniref:NAD-dependent epimerase/dehydratase family protein n=1 Tax=uncultured Algoriphagus sp. TaxID=417365 RepID=UPI0030EC0EEC|tara:strand:+ start:58644 stop:59720 length:1077 start_codon:yes stop_codon:yes gene_type:complete